MADAPEPTKRLFFALAANPALRKSISQWRAGLRLRSGKPVPAENFHITLMFLGAVPIRDIDAICRAVDALPGPGGSLLLALDRLDLWPRVQALVLAAEQPPKPLLRLVYNLQQALLPLGFADAHREYRPHLTLARDVRGALPEASVAPDFLLRAHAFALYESARGGYRVIRAWPLAQP
ncbi:RNA 2',3'-cyclic phosphodiesterase [Pseudomonas typographi]|uniref:RNA 2',3'-cyclic phosphodiesterase n=1 Tax=Pseudomonas typographi TaxID=2715964 RepID=A0ABR7Z3X5_9PSED|nr:RNA 2',3'-cyclic phosphodiesterase [Pseudomonas typographi]MBD1552670.1 RNA 2',3'-cyclic phosphodiesterase [Pseudomonas typographi]MBD1588151.1 RNA 2',3'-cyclic phosphodiesterase [Pseudomonas typographi]MBD1600122.1 RNA 2',3'-cyclic phosphodiesterase [Pseudomonas typographi]